MNIYLTYDNTACQDGVGAQIQRIIGIRAVARRLGLGYLHAPIVHTHNQGWAAQTQGLHDPEYLARWESLMQLAAGQVPLDEVGIPFERTLHVERLTPLRLGGLLAGTSLRRLAGAGPGSSVLVRVKLPYPIVDRWPATYELIREELLAAYASSPKPPLRSLPGPLHVAVHVRRGDVNRRSRAAARLVPNEVYLRAMRQVLAQAGSREVHFHIYSEGELDSAEDNFREFAITRQVYFHLNEDACSTFHHLVSADVLIMSKSSFSFVAGLYSSGLVLYLPFWHPCLPRWVPLARDGSANPRLLAARWPAAPALRRAA